jgi:type IV secretion system protein VirB9
VVCAPLYVCDIALQAGETVNDLDIGDAVRWKVTPASSGSGPDTTTHVIVKPTDTGLTTNLLITTNRRTYSIKLVSREHDWMPSVSFAYPEDARAKWAAFQQDRQQTRNASTLATGENVANLDFQYRLSGDSPGWKPVRVYNTGSKTYIEFPPSVVHGDLPALVALGNDGGLFSSPTPRMINYRLVGDRFEIDSVLDHAALITGVGSDQERVEITHLGLALTACATVGPNTSWVGTLQPGDSAAIAEEMAAFLKKALPAAKSTLYLDQTKTVQGGDLLTPMLTESLRKAGFALVSDRYPAGNAHVVRYLVTPSQDGVLIRLAVDQAEGSEFMSRNGVGGLTKMAFTIRRAEP